MNLPMKKLKKKKSKKFKVIDEKPVEVIDEKLVAEVIDEKSEEVINDKPTEVIEETLLEVVKDKPEKVIDEKLPEVIDEKSEEVVEEKPVEVIDEKPVEVIDEKSEDNINTIGQILRNSNIQLRSDIQSNHSKQNIMVDDLEKSQIELTNDKYSDIISEKHFVDKNYNDILMLILSTSSFQYKYNFNISPQIIVYISSIIKKHESYFNTFGHFFDTIIYNKQININDVPKLLFLLKNLYEILINFNAKNKIKECEIIFKFVMNIIFYENINNINERDNLLLIINNLIDSCLELIEINKNKKNIFSCF